MQRHRINGEGFCLLFARPFEPRGAVFQGVGEDFDFVVGESVLCLFEEFGDLVGVAGVVESQDGRQVGVVGVFLFGLFAEAAVGSDAGGRVVSSGGGVVAVVLDFGGLEVRLFCAIGGSLPPNCWCYEVSDFYFRAKLESPTFSFHETLEICTVNLKMFTYVRNFRGIRFEFFFCDNTTFYELCFCNDERIGTRMTL